jgi:hypothetical protein
MAKRKPSWKSLAIDRILILPKRFPCNLLGTIFIKNKGSFYAREMKMFEALFKKYPKQDFWEKVALTKKPESLSYFASDFGKKILKEKYNEFNYKIPKAETISLGEKQGKDKTIEIKPKTIRDFLK